MTLKDHYKLGFLTKMAAMGITPAQMVAFFENDTEKTAAGEIPGADTVKDLISSIWGVGGTALGYGAVAAALTGALTGYARAHMTDVSPEDVELAKIKDYSGTYRSEAAKMRRADARDKWRKKLIDEGGADANGGPAA